MNCESSGSSNVDKTLLGDIPKDELQINSSSLNVLSFMLGLYKEPTALTTMNEAIAEDKKLNHLLAFNLYKQSLQMFYSFWLAHLNIETHQLQEYTKVMNRFSLYLSRAEFLAVQLEKTKQIIRYPDHFFKSVFKFLNDSNFVANEECCLLQQPPKHFNFDLDRPFLQKK